MKSKSAHSTLKFPREYKPRPESMVEKDPWVPPPPSADHPLLPDPLEMTSSALGTGGGDTGDGGGREIVETTQEVGESVYLV